VGRHHTVSVLIQQVGPGQQALAVVPTTLMHLGCNLQVEIATARAFVNNLSSPLPRRSLTVMAHLDTGASQCNISPIIAKHLGLVATGVTSAQTANGTVQNPTYAIDLLFGASTLAPKFDLAVGSCTLPFDLQKLWAEPNSSTNFGLLIGRDVMSSWHITWDGPTSTVIISD
jgi:hypothetical protein